MSLFNLHCHTMYSFLDGYGTPKQYLSRLKELGQDGMAVTDHGTIYSHVPFFKGFEKEGKHLIFGCEMYAVERLEKERGYYHVTVLVKTNEGYSNLLWLVNQSNRQKYYKPRVTFEQLSNRSAGLILLSGCFCDGWFIKGGSFEVWNHWFKKAEWYVELQPFKDEQEKWDRLVSLVKKRSLPALVTFDTHYPRPEDKKSHDFMLAINTRKPLSDPDRLKLDYPLHIPSYEEALSKCKEMGSFEARWLNSTVSVAKTCQVELPRTKTIRVGANIGKIKEACYKKLKSLNLLKNHDYIKRVEYETKFIVEKEFEDYFTIVWDLMKWARKRFLCSPGRGSSAGSLVCYLLGITAVDPIRYRLLFERFIDVNRKDLPDIDLDFPASKRDEVIDYLKKKYGEEKTAQLVTFGTFKPKGLLQDICRVLEIPGWEIKGISNQLITRQWGDARFDSCLEDSLEKHEKVKEFFNKHPDGIPAIHLEGQVKQKGKHAAAVVVSDIPLEEIGSIDEGIFSTDMDHAEEFGLLKIDILGLETLDIVENVCEAVGMDWRKLDFLPLDDSKVYDTIFIPAKLEGVFQFEGMATKRVCEEVKPSTFNQLVHITALSRPGASDSGAAKDYVERQRIGNYEKDLLLEPYTEETFGLIVFQEQVMKVLRGVANLPWEDVSEIRKGIVKSKGVEFLNQFKDKFVSGAAKEGVSEHQARSLWEKICTYGGYGFNLSHAVSYSIVSYWTAWLKTYYPLPFYARILKNEIDEFKIRSILKEFNGSFVPLDLNRSRTYFSVSEDGQSLIGGFTNIRGIGETNAARITKGQPYESIQDFQSRIPTGVSNRVMEALEQGLPWTHVSSFSKNLENKVSSIKLRYPFRKFDEFMVSSDLKLASVLCRITEVIIKDHNSDEKVQKRGYSLTGPSEYAIVKVHDEEFNQWVVCFDRFLFSTNRSKVLTLTNKICLLRVRKEANGLLIGENFKEMED